MGAGHGRELHRGVYREGDTVVHRLPAHCKLLALVAFVLLVVATPRERFWAYGCYAALLAGVAALSRVPPGFVARRATVELPFVAFAVLLPFLAGGPVVTVPGVPLPLHRAGLLAAWGILAKGTLGVVGSVLLAATTRPRDLLLGLQRLRAPAPLVQIATFMLRYAEVVTGELRRMRVARDSRGFDGRGPHAARVLARSAGALFVRSYERGERVYLAMLSRGYSGALPAPYEGGASAGQWAAAAVLPAAALVVAVAAWGGWSWR